MKYFDGTLSLDPDNLQAWLRSPNFPPGGILIVNMLGSDSAAYNKLCGYGDGAHVNIYGAIYSNGGTENDLFMQNSQVLP